MSRRPLHAAPGPLLLALSLLIAVAPRAFGQEVARPLVIDLTTGTKTPREAAISALLARETPLKPGTYPLISWADPAFMDAYRWAHPAGPDVKCPHPLQDLNEQFNQVSELIIGLDLDNAISLLEKAYDTIPCQITPIRREMLWKLFYLEGIARHYAEDGPGSNRAFLEALVVNPVLERLKGFPPDVTDLYINEARRLASLPPMKLEISPELRQSGVRIDGQPLPDTPVLSIQPGRHMAQVIGENGIARSAVFRIEPGESRRLETLFDLQPPGSARVLKEELGTAVKARDLSPAQVRALSTIALTQKAPSIMFVVIDTGGGGEKLLTFVPGRGLITGAPKGLSELPPFAPGEPRGLRIASQARPAGTGTTGGGSTKTTPATPEPEQDNGDLHSQTLRLTVGLLRYDTVNFSDLLPSYSRRLIQGLFAQAGLFYANDFGASTGEPRSMVGVRLGLEYEWSIRAFQPRIGLGYGIAAARIEDDGETRRLVLEATPEAWIGLDYRLGELPLRVGIDASRGFTPGFVGESRGLWRGGLSVTWQMP